MSSRRGRGLFFILASFNLAFFFTIPFAVSQDADLDNPFLDNPNSQEPPSLEVQKLMDDYLKSLSHQSDADRSVLTSGESTILFSIQVFNDYSKYGELRNIELDLDSEELETLVNLALQARKKSVDMEHARQANVCNFYNSSEASVLSDSVRAIEALRLMEDPDIIRLDLAVIDHDFQNYVRNSLGEDVLQQVLTAKDELANKTTGFAMISSRSFFGTDKSEFVESTCGEA